MLTSKDSERGPWLYRILATFVLVLLGCADSQATEACGETTCVLSMFSAACAGDSADPILACNPSGGSCKWYSGGCPLPAVPLPAEAFECEHGCCPADWLSRGDFSESSERARAQIAALVGPLMDNPVANLSVVVDPDMEVPEGPPTIRCDPSLSLSLCDRPLEPVRIFRTDTSTMVQLDTGFVTDALSFELGARSHALIAPQPDATPSELFVCRGNAILEGVLTVSADPATGFFSGHAELVFETGRAELTF